MPTDRIILIATIDLQHGEPVANAVTFRWRGTEQDETDAQRYVDLELAGSFARVYTFAPSTPDPHGLAMAQILAAFAAQPHRAAA